jgi:chromosome segregation ATPase
MSEQTADIESALSAALQERSETYVRARESLLELERRLDAGQTPLHAVCPELHGVLEVIRVADERLAPLQEQWTRLALRPGPGLAEQIQRHQSQLEQTLTIINRLTETARADREQLAPRLDEVARGRRMQAAYAASGGY